MAGQGSGCGVAMPADRLLHARLGHSAKVSSLSDLEYRVWTTYVLGADDFGVMRADAVAFQAAHDALCARPAKAIKRCIERLVEVGLVAAFAHQGSRYLYQTDWQDFQRVRYPLRTVHPLPAAAEVSAKTQHLWSVHPGGAKVPALPRSSRTVPGRFPGSSGSPSEKRPDDSRRSSEQVPEHSRTSSETLPPHARSCETANGLWLMAREERGAGGEGPRRQAKASLRGRGGGARLDGAARGVRRGDRASEAMSVGCGRCERTPGWESVVVEGVSRLQRCGCWRAAHAAPPSVPREFRDARWSTWRKTVENGHALDEARAFVRAGAEGPDLFLCGPVGTGKTRLACTVVNEAWKSGERSVAFARVPMLLYPAPAALRGGGDGRRVQPADGGEAAGARRPRGGAGRGDRLHAADAADALRGTPRRRVPDHLDLEQDAGRGGRVHGGRPAGEPHRGPLPGGRPGGRDWRLAGRGTYGQAGREPVAAGRAAPAMERAR